MYSALIMAAGQGLRSGLTFNKNLFPIKGKPMILYSVEQFLSDPDCQEVIVVTAKQDIDTFKLVLPAQTIIVSGGKSRQESVLSGLKIVKTEYVFIHDGARPNLKKAAIEKLKQALLLHEALSMATPVKDTLKICTNQEITKDIDRENTFCLQTPQVFPTKAILEAHILAKTNKHQYSDDTSIYLHELGKKVFIVDGYDDNIKATTLTDMKILEALI